MFDFRLLIQLHLVKLNMGIHGTVPHNISV